MSSYAVRVRESMDQALIGMHQRNFDGATGTDRGMVGEGKEGWGAIQFLSTIYGPAEAMSQRSATRTRKHACFVGSSDTVCFYLLGGAPNEVSGRNLDRSLYYENKQERRDLEGANHLSRRVNAAG